MYVCVSQIPKMQCNAQQFQLSTRVGCRSSLSSTVWLQRAHRSPSDDVIGTAFDPIQDVGVSTSVKGTLSRLSKRRAVLLTVKVHFTVQIVQCSGCNLPCNSRLILVRDEIHWEVKHSNTPYHGNVHANMSLLFTTREIVQSWHFCYCFAVTSMWSAISKSHDDTSGCSRLVVSE